MPSCQFCLPVPTMISTDHFFQVGMANLFALEFPQRSTLCSCSSVHASRSTDFTRLICVPIPRCIPEHLQDLSVHLLELSLPPCSRIPNAHKDAQIPACPSWVYAKNTKSASQTLSQPILEGLVTCLTYACSACSLHSSCFPRALAKS